LPCAASNDHVRECSEDCPQGDAVTGAEHTVMELIARFALRRNASSAEFAAGVWLVSAGAVRLQHLSTRVLQAFVRDGTTEAVHIIAEGERLIGECSCGSARGEICRHQVAAAHAVWLELPTAES